MFRFSDKPIVAEDLRSKLAQPGCGGYAAFEGWVRNRNEGHTVSQLEYEAFEALALKEGERVIAEALSRFEIETAACVHRLGKLDVGDLAVWVGVSAAHRDAAFAACRYVIDEVKARVPIWKKEFYTDAESKWVNCDRCGHESAVPDYTRQTILKDVGENGQAKLADSRVLVIGAGGLGSPALLYLTAAGIGTIGIVDADCLEASNLHRQVIYDFKDIGKSKTELAARRLATLNPAVQIHTYDKKLNPENIEETFRQYDLVLDCTDDLEAKYLINDAAVLTATPVVFTSVHQYEGQLQIYLPEDQSACLRCLWPEPGAAASCSETGVLGPVPGVFGTLQAMEAIKYLLDLPGKLGDHLLLFNLLDYSVQKIKARRSAGCIGSGRCTRVTGLDTWREPVTFEVECESLENAMRAGYVPVDIRNIEEVVASPLDVETQRIPMAELESDPSILDDKGKYLLVCAHGVRSRQTAKRLRSLGFDVYSLSGGATALAAHHDEV